MRSPNIILENLQKHSKAEDYRYERLYRNLYNADFYLQAYQNIYANKGSMTPGIDGMTLDGFGRQRVEKLIASLKDHSYQPTSVKRVYIPKKDGKKRPLGIASSDDKLVQEIIRMLLESIFEPTFSNLSHGFRAKRSCHTALSQIQHNFTGVKWFIEGDIKAYFDTIDHHILMSILRRRIKDEHFLSLIWKFLRAGYLEKWEYNATYSGVAQGSGFSPILANIYLNELDKYMEEYTDKFSLGRFRKPNKEYGKLHSRHQRYVEKHRKIWLRLSNDEKKAALKETIRLRKDFLSVPSKDPMDEGYRRLKYTRYADDFIIGVIGSYEDAERIKSDIKVFLADKLKLELSDEKTLITSGKDKARFLSYDITICKDTSTKKTSRGQSRIYYDKVKLYVPKDKWVGKLLQYDVLKIINKAGEKEKWMPLQRDEYIYLAPNEMIMKYNEQIRGLYNYYRIANNVSVLNKFYYIMQYSLYKTIAAKFKITMTKAKLKYTKDKVFSVPYETKNGTKYAVFYNKGFVRNKKPLYDNLDITPEYSHLYKPRELFYRYKAGKCELCDKKCDEITVHQVNSLLDLKGNTDWEKLMKKKRRKTLIVCEGCHRLIHNET
jgi:group II intron reverse transcriptase/maturase